MNGTGAARGVGPAAGTAPNRRFLVRLWLAGVAVATVFSATSVLLLKAGSAVNGAPLPWVRALAGAPDWYVWALFLPVVVLLARRFPLDHGRWGRSLAVHVPLGLGVALLELGAFTLVNVWYNRAVLGSPYPSLGWAYVNILSRWLPLAFLIYALVVAIMTAVDHARRSRERAVTAARLETELERAKAHALRAQIQPHFLFNALNTIAMLVRQGRGDAAVEAMASLGGILRRSMDPAGGVETTLERELAFVEDYLRVERYRLEDRLRVSFDVDPAALGARLPPLILQPLVENAVRHGIADLAQGGAITITARHDGGALDLSVHDTGRGFHEPPAEGIGLSNVRARLHAHYGGQARLAITSDPGRGTLVTIRLPYTEAAGRWVEEAVAAAEGTGRPS